MKDIQIVIAALASIILFVFGLENFSKEVQRITGERFRKFISRATSKPVIGVLIGAIVTAFIQSSSATSIIAISLVNAGVLSFKNSVGIIFGSNVGTTLTAQLVAFKLTSFAPIFLILGFLLSFARNKFSVFGKTLFYFGFVFFSLNLISDAIAPLQNDPRIVELLTQKRSPLWGVLIGMLVTAVVQSSSVTTGLSIIFVQQGLMSLENAIPIVMGANVGTTATALISMVSMDIAAKKTALAHFLFNFGGVLLFLPVIYSFQTGLPFLTGRPAVDLANFHLVFNLSTSLAFILFLGPFTRFIDRVMGEGKMDFERFDLQPLTDEIKVETIERDLIEKVKLLYAFVQENYNLVTLSIETNYKGVYEVAKKRIEYVEFIKHELKGYFSTAATLLDSEKDLQRLIRVMGVYDYIFQIHDSIKDISGTKESMDSNYVEMRSDLLLKVRELASRTLSLFGAVGSKGTNGATLGEVKKEAKEVQAEIEEFNKEILKIMAKPDRSDAGVVYHLVTYNQRLKDKLLNYFSLVQKLEEADPVKEP